jgi:hypothetical protein
MFVILLPNVSVSVERHHQEMLKYTQVKATLFIDKPIRMVLFLIAKISAVHKTAAA